MLTSYIRITCILSIILPFLLGCGDSHGFKNEIPYGSVNENYVMTSGISNQKVTAIEEDSLGQIWVGTFRGLNRLDSRDVFQYFSSATDTLTLPDNQITDILCDSKGRMWISTVNGVCIHTERDNFIRIGINSPFVARELIETQKGKMLINQYACISEYNEATNSFNEVIDDCGSLNVSYAYIDKNDLLWVVNNKEILCYDTDSYKRIDRIEVGNVYSSHMTHNGFIWIGTDSGLKILDTRTRSFSNIPNVIKENKKLMSSPIISIYDEKRGSILLVTNSSDVFYFSPCRGGKLYEYGEKEFPINVPTNNINKFFYDSQQNLWMGSLDQGISVLYKDNRRFNRDNHLRQLMQQKSVIALTHDNEDNLWITTLYDGVWLRIHDSREVIRTNIDDLLANQPGKNKFVPNKIQLASANWSSGIHTIFVDNDNYLWMAGVANVYKVKHMGHGVLRIEESFDIESPMCFNQDVYGTMWIGTMSNDVYAKRSNETSFKKINLYDAVFTFTTNLTNMKDGNILAIAFPHKMKVINSSSHEAKDLEVSDEDYKRAIPRSAFIPTATFIDDKGDIWIGTICNGLLHYDIKEHRLSPIPGAPCSDISGIEQDSYGNIWVSTQQGLGYYNRDTKEFTTFSKSDGTDGDQYYDRSSCHMNDGTLVFGGTHGLTFFTPMDIRVNHSSRIMFQQLTINNKVARPDNNDVLENSISQTDEISLKYDKNNISISYTMIDFCPYPRVKYRHRMTGIDNEWIESGHIHKASYNNLPKGDYTFEVEALSTNDNSIVATKSLLIHVLSPWWKSWWAILLYIFVFLALATDIYFIRARTNHARERERRALEEAAQEQRINQMNMSFFSNVSHEFRTPLTMIAGPLSQLMQGDNISEQNSQLFQMISRNVDRMLRLVNQLMDFGKMDNDMLRLSVCPTDISSQINHMVDIFRVNAQEKRITFRTTGLEEQVIAWVDLDKVEKIVNNLLGNAIKFTPQGGTIQLSLDVLPLADVKQSLPHAEHRHDSHYICLKVTDNGEGLPDDEIEQIFERFYQAKNNSLAHVSLGTGIGLYYARGLAKIHHGWLYAENRPDGQGSVFTCLLPFNKDTYSHDELAKEADIPSNEMTALNLSNPNMPTAEQDVNYNETTILVVDDDTEVAHYLKTLLSPKYNVICKFDVDSALIAINDQLPDIVLSDVVMPGKDGYELCRTIKQDVQISHVPVILVTAKGSVENQVEGLRIGADAYVPKPFDPTYILALIQSLLSNRERQRKVLSESTQTNEIEQDVLSPQDNAFMSNLYELMEAELSNSELDVTIMAEKLNMSRTKFYYKVKALTGEAPGVFFKTYKLNRAAELLKEGTYNVSEVAEKTGFGTLSHFSTSFKKRFGVAPTGYR